MKGCFHAQVLCAAACIDRLLVAVSAACFGVGCGAVTHHSCACACWGEAARRDGCGDGALCCVCRRCIAAHWSSCVYLCMCHAMWIFASVFVASYQLLQCGGCCCALLVSSAFVEEYGGREVLVLTVRSSTLGGLVVALGDRVVTDLYVLIVLYSGVLSGAQSLVRVWHTQNALHGLGARCARHWVLLLLLTCTGVGSAMAAASLPCSCANMRH
jgi:hypothetical protein